MRIFEYYDRCYLALQTSLCCSPAEEAFSSQALLSLLHNALSKVLGKMLVKDAYLEKFNQCLIIDGYLIAKVVPDDNELVLNNDGLVLNNVGQVPNNHELVPNNDEQVPNDKNQYLIMNYNDSHGYNRNKAMIWLKWHPIVTLDCFQA